MSDDDDHRVQRRRDGDELAALGRLLPRPGPKTYGFLVWWVLGLYCLFAASAPYSPTIEEEQRYSDLMSQAIFSEEMRQAQQALVMEQRHLDEVHVWGWRWRPPYDRKVPEAQRRVAAARQVFDAEVKYRDGLVSEAKSNVGLWSPVGVDEVRKRFWAAYQDGKDFAKRMSFWDVMFAGMGRGRDEEAWVSILRFVGQIMMNFTIGLISALISFSFALVSMIWEYKASLASGIAFFVVAFSGASAMVALFIGGMYTTAVGGVYVVAKQAQQARLEGRAPPRQRYVRHGGGYPGQRPHWQ